MLNVRLSDFLSDRFNSFHALFENNVELFFKKKKLSGPALFKFNDQVEHS